MTDRQTCHTELDDLLHAEYVCTGKLNALLSAESEALVARDVDTLEQLVKDKHDLIQTFGQLEERMQQLLLSAGFGTGRTDIEACINWCDNNGRLKKGWRLLLERILLAQHKNRVNGATLEATRSHAQQSLALLRGQSPESPLYNPTGNTGVNHLAGRTLAKA
jgi:flagellar biosynthesis/type III secretory pathway chaperone